MKEEMGRKKKYYTPEVKVVNLRKHVALLLNSDGKDPKPYGGEMD